MLRINQLETEVTRELTEPLKEVLRKFNYNLPASLQAQVSLLDANGRKKRSTAAADNWTPESGRIEIRFELVAEEPRQTAREISPTIKNQPPMQSTNLSRPTPNTARQDSVLHPAELDLLKSLDRAESKPGWSFVPLKKFRDEILRSEHFRSMPTDVEQRNVLRSVIDKKFVLVGKVPNPKNPEFPVTTIRLNRLMPEVKAALGEQDGPDLDFHPVSIPGEPLSSTVLRDRR